LELIARMSLLQSGALFHVRFTFDRTPLRRMHAALAAPTNPHFDILTVLPSTLSKA
jgi:hypothetical protein